MRQSRLCGPNNTDTRAQGTKLCYLFGYRETNRNSTVAINMAILERVWEREPRRPWALDTVFPSRC